MHATFVLSFRRGLTFCAELVETECTECGICLLLLGMRVETLFQMIDCRGKRLELVLDGILVVNQTIVTKQEIEVFELLLIREAKISCDVRVGEEVF